MDGLNSDKAIGVSIISSSRLFREGLVLLLNNFIPVYLVADYAAEMLPDGNSLPNPASHLILLDSTIGYGKALVWMTYWRGCQPTPPILCLEIPNTPALILSFIEAGASGYMLENASPKEVAALMRLVLQGGTACSAEIAAALFKRVAASHSFYTITTPLSEREFEVLKCITRGYSNKEIACELYITVRTVKHHIHNILRKLNLTRRQEAARYAAEQGWLLR